MRILTKLIQKIFLKSDDKEYLEISRNERCFCESGKKYKNCHLTLLEKKGKIALYEIDKKTKKIKIYSKRKFKGTSIKQATSLRGADVKATNIALNDHNPEVHDIYKF